MTEGQSNRIREDRCTDSRTYTKVEVKITACIPNIKSLYCNGIGSLNEIQVKY